MKNVHYVFHKYKDFDASGAPDIHVSDLHFYEDALFEFVYQTLGYAILEVSTEKETKIEVKEV